MTKGYAWNVSFYTVETLTTCWTEVLWYQVIIRWYIPDFFPLSVAPSLQDLRLWDWNWKRAKLQRVAFSQKTWRILNVACYQLRFCKLFATLFAFFYQFEVKSFKCLSTSLHRMEKDKKWAKKWKNCDNHVR